MPDLSATPTTDLFQRATDLHSRSMSIQMDGSAALSGRFRRSLELNRERYAVEAELERRGFKFDPEDTCQTCGRHNLAPCGNCGRRAA